MGRNDILYNMRQILSAMTVVAKETVPNVKYPLTVSITAIGGGLVESNITIDKGSRPFCFFVMFFLPVVFLFPALGCGFKNLHPLQSYFFSFLSILCFPFSFFCMRFFVVQVMSCNLRGYVQSQLNYRRWHVFKYALREKLFRRSLMTHESQPS